MSEWVQVQDYNNMIATECIGCGKPINLGYTCSIPVLMLCDECKEAIKFAKKLLKEQEAKKPKRDPVWEFVCPRDGCNHRLRFLQSYCDLCGQALNWKEI